MAVTTNTTDTTPPVIDGTSIQAFPSDTRAILQWTTDEPSDSKISFGPHPDTLNITLVDPSTVTAHTFTVTSLTPGATYYYRLFATDASNNKGASTVMQTFKTPAAPTNSG